MSPDPTALIAGTSELATRVRAFDWAATPLGPIATWPRALVAHVSMILELPDPAIIFWGPEQTQIYNDGYALIMGPRHPRYLGAPYRECWPDTYPTIYPWMRRVLDHGETIRVDRALIPVTRFGFAEDTYFSFTFSPLRDDEGRIAGVFQPVSEVTIAVLAQRRGETLRALVPRAEETDPLANADAALRTNPGDLPHVRVYCGTPLRPVIEIGDVPDEPRLAQLAAGARDSSTEHGDAFVVPLRRHGDNEWFGAVVFLPSPRLPLDDHYRAFLELVADRIGGAIGVRAARQAARDERQRLTAMLMNAPGGFALLAGPDFVLELANPVYLRAIGAGERDLGRPLAEIIPEIREQGFVALLEETRRTGTPYRSPATRVQLGDRVYFLEFVYEPLGDDAILVFFVDMTTQVSAQQAVAGALEEARRANRAKDEFLALLGHELRNPMAPIVTALELMELRGDTGVGNERRVIARQAEHLVRLVDDLLDVSRIARGTFELHLAPTRLAEAIARAAEIAAPLFAQRKHDLAIDVPPDLAGALDPDRIQQVFGNLLVNAAKFTPPGGRVTVEARREGDELVVRVRDTGEGIAPEILPRVFDMFVQERQDLARRRGGLGLGLAIVRAIVRRHGGEAVARSAGPGLGTEMEVRLPAVAAAAAVVAPPPPAPLARTTAGRVLVVDDNLDAADLLATVLRTLGHAVEVVHDGGAALTAAASFRPDVALLDIGLPVMDGYAVARALRADPATRSIHLVAVTGYSQASDRAASERAGFDRHLTKPVDIARVAATLEQLLSG